MIRIALGINWAAWIAWAAVSIAWQRRQGKTAVVCDVLLIPVVLSVTIVILGLFAPRLAFGLSVITSCSVALVAVIGLVTLAVGWLRERRRA